MEYTKINKECRLTIYPKSTVVIEVEAKKLDFFFFFYNRDRQKSRRIIINHNNP